MMHRFTHFELTRKGDPAEQVGQPEGLPDISDLLDRLRFSPSLGEIRMSDQRLLLINNATFVTLRRELFETLGASKARATLFQVGYGAGSREARIAWEMRQDRPEIDAFMVGPQMHALRGETYVEPVEIHGDVETGEYYSELIWRNSAESEAHILAFGGSSEPVCWMQLGYASGYTSVVMDKSIIFREIACSACGDEACRIVGKPAEEWQDVPRKGFERFHVSRPKNKNTVPEENLTSVVEDDVAGSSPGFLSAWHLAMRVAPHNTTVLLQGETGVGKEIFAKSIHRHSTRKDKDFFALNCAAIPDSLITTELFGVEKGAYTGASDSRSGWFEAANGSTLFLDEIGTLPLPAQAELLRVLQEGYITRVGSTRERPVDVRIVCATNENLEKMCLEGEFRTDLLFRINVFPIRIPPLRERREDLPLLIEAFFNRLSLPFQLDEMPGLTVEAIDMLMSYEFPGNVRELENMLERACILRERNEPITTFHLFSSKKRTTNKVTIRPSVDGSLALEENTYLSASELDLSALKAKAIEQAMTQAGGNISKAARLLGITRSKLRYYLQR